MTFPDINADLRSDIQFDEMANTSHHNGQSPFSELKIGMVSQFPLDFMHLVCLGVVKCLIGIWTKRPRDGHRISACSVQRLSENLLSLRKHLPKEFLRKGRPIFKK